MLHWSQESGFNVNEPSVSRNYITSLDGLQSTVAGQARQLRTTALLKSEADYYNSQDENIPQEEWLNMSEDERQAVRDANKERVQGDGPVERSREELQGYDKSRSEGFLSQIGGMVSDSLLSIVGTNSSNAGFVDKDGNFVPRTCFVAGTNVLVKGSHGAELREIQTLRVQDQVWACHENTGGSCGWYAITAVHSREANGYYWLTASSRKVGITADHPIHVPGSAARLISVPDFLEAHRSQSLPQHERRNHHKIIPGFQFAASLTQLRPFKKIFVDYGAGRAAAAPFPVS